MLTDFAALLLAWLAFRIARRPADWRRTYGFDRLSVLAAFVNGLALFVIAGGIAVEAARRLMQPVAIEGGLMLGVAVLGLLVNVAAFWVLTRAEGPNLNVRAAALHVMGDLLGSAGAIVAALVILATDWRPIDPLLSVLVGSSSCAPPGRWCATARISCSRPPPRASTARRVRDDLQASVPGLVRVEHLHAWSITEERPMVTLEAFLDPGSDAEAARTAIKRRLGATFGIDHATVEIRRTGEPNPTAADSCRTRPA